MNWRPFGVSDKVKSMKNATESKEVYYNPDEKNKKVSFTVV